MPWVHDHIGATGHVARCARYRGICCLVMMVSRRSVRFGVALQAEPIAGHTQLGAMRLMTVAACHASGKHSALLERTVIIHFVAHLTVDFIKSTGQ